MRTPVCTRSTSNGDSSVMCTIVPRYQRTVKPWRPTLLRGQRLRVACFIIAFPYFPLNVARSWTRFPAIRSLLALDEKIYELRREKLKQIEALGQPSYPTKYEFTHTVPQILSAYSDRTAEQMENPRVTARVAGRIMAIRLMGKAGFPCLQQDGHCLQIYVKK